MRSFAVVALGALMGAHGVELISVPKILPDTMPSREGEPIRYDLPHEFLNLQGPAPRQRKVSDYIIGDLQEAGTVVTDDSETGYMWRRLILEKFNAIRKNDGYEANYMTKLRWDFHLEAYAEQWAKYSCQNSEPNYVQKTRPDWPWGYATGELNGGGCEKYTSLPPFVQSMTDGATEDKWMFEWDNDALGPLFAVDWQQISRQDAQYVGCSLIEGCHSSCKSAAHMYMVCGFDVGTYKREDYNPYEKQDSGKGCSTCPQGYDCCEENSLCVGYAPVNSILGQPLAPPGQNKGGKCPASTWNRSLTDMCAGTGASHVSNGTLPGDVGLEFNTCHCGKGPSPKNFLHTVSHGYTWFEGRCYIQTTEISSTKEQPDEGAKGLVQKHEDTTTTEKPQVQGILTTSTGKKDVSSVTTPPAKDINSAEEQTASSSGATERFALSIACLAYLRWC